MTETPSLHDIIRLALARDAAYTEAAEAAERRAVAEGWRLVTHDGGNPDETVTVLDAHTREVLWTGPGSAYIDDEPLGAEGEDRWMHVDNVHDDVPLPDTLAVDGWPDSLVSVLEDWATRHIDEAEAFLRADR